MKIHKYCFTYAMQHFINFTFVSKINYILKSFNLLQIHSECIQLLSNRSKQNNDDSTSNYQQQQKTLSTPKANEKRVIHNSGLSTSPSHQVLQTMDSQQSTQLTPQQQSNNGQQQQQQINIIKPKKTLTKQQTNNNNENTIQQQTIVEQEDESEAIERDSKSENRKIIKVIRQQNDDQNHITPVKDSSNSLKYNDRQKLKENAQQIIDGQVQRSRDDRKAYHMPSAKLDELPRVTQLSQSPSNMSLGQPEGSPLIHAHNQQTKSLNPTNISKNNIITQTHLQQFIQGYVNILKATKQHQQSPNFKRIVNIYSVNNYQKKKKYILNNNNNSISSYGIQGNNVSTLSNPNQIYKGEDIKLKLQQLREGMGYYDGKSLSSINNGGREVSLDQSHNHQSHNNSVLLPELKSITPQIQNIKNNYSMMNSGSNSYSNSNSVAKLINRKKSYERLMRIDQQAYHLYKHQNGKIEIQNPIRSGGIHQYGLKQRPHVYYNGNSNYSILSKILCNYFILLIVLIYFRNNWKQWSNDSQ